MIPREPWEDRQRDGGLDARLDTLERRLHAAVDRIEDVPVALERRMAAMESELQRRLEEFELTVSAVERVAGTEFPGRLSELAGGLATLEGRVEEIGSLVGELAGILGQLRATASSGRQEMATAARSVEARLVATVRGAADEFLTDASDVIADARTAGAQLERTAGRAADLHDVLAEHRAALAATLRRDRAALVDDVLELVLDALAPRQRRALADKLLARERRREEELEAGGGPAAATPAAATPATASTPPPPPPARVAVPPPPTSPTGTEDPAVDDLPEPETAPPAAASSARADRRTAEQAREELVATVLEVDGVGPSRAAALADAFRTLERLGVSDVEEVVALTGMFPKHADAVLDHVRSVTP